MSELSDEKKQEVIGLLKAGKKIEAIKVHREATGYGLKESKEAVEALAKAEGVVMPEAGCGSASALLLAAGGTLAYLLLR